jgi:hypothetical protein
MSGCEMLSLKGCELPCVWEVWSAVLVEREVTFLWGCEVPYLWGCSNVFKGVWSGMFVGCVKWRVYGGVKYRVNGGVKWRVYGPWRAVLVRREMPYLWRCEVLQLRERGVSSQDRRSKPVTQCAEDVTIFTLLRVEQARRKWSCWIYSVSLAC